MKTLQLLLVAIILTFALQINAENQKEDRNQVLTVQMTIRVAMQHFDLVRAMYAQVNPSMLNNEAQKYYTAKVVHKNVVFVITGKYEEWMNFFYMDNTSPVYRKQVHK